MSLFANTVEWGSDPRSRPAVQIRKSTETRLDTELLKQTCLIINTADYCQTTASELEEKIKEKINPEYKEKISFQGERDMFIGTISSAIAVQLRELEVVCDASFLALSRTSWSSINQVSGPSAYTGDLVKSVEQVAELMKPLIEQKKYLRNFFDKACRSVILSCCSMCVNLICTVVVSAWSLSSSPILR